MIGGLSPSSLYFEPGLVRLSSSSGHDAEELRRIYNQPTGVGTSSAKLSFDVPIVRLIAGCCCKVHEKLI